MVGDLLREICGRVRSKKNSVPVMPVGKPDTIRPPFAKLRTIALNARTKSKPSGFSTRLTEQPWHELARTILDGCDRLGIQMAVKTYALFVGTRDHLAAISLKYVEMRFPNDWRERSRRSAALNEMSANRKRPPGRCGVQRMCGGQYWRRQLNFACPGTRGQYDRVSGSDLCIGSIKEHIALSLAFHPSH